MRIGEKAQEKKGSVCGFYRLLSGIKIMYDDNSACVRVKWGENERSRIDSWVYHVSLAVQCILLLLVLLLLYRIRVKGGKAIFE